MQAVGFVVGERTVFFVPLSESGFHSLQLVGDWGRDFFHERCDANRLPFVSTTMTPFFTRPRYEGDGDSVVDGFIME